MCSLKIPEIKSKWETVNIVQIHINHNEVVSNAFNLIKRDLY